MVETMTSQNLHFCKLFSLLLLLSLPAFGLNLDGTLLLSFKYSIQNDPLSLLDNWNYNDATPCSWTGVTCDIFSRVISLSLPNSKLLAIVPEELGFMPHLKTLDLSGNFLNGTLPNSIFNASEIHVISLSRNAINGALPEIVSGGLKVINLSQNALTGKIPNRIRFIEYLDLSSNLLNGSLPIEFGGDNLKYLNLSSNKLSGLVPPGFAEKIPENATVDLSFNDLSGEIPASIALSNQKTESFSGNAELCGKPLKKLCTIPSSLSNPPNVSTNSSSPAIAAIPKTIGEESPVTTPTAEIPAQHGLKPSVIAGIAVVPLAGIGLLAALGFYIHQKRKKKPDSTNSVSYEFRKDPQPPSMAVEEKEMRKVQAWSCLSATNGGETSESTESDEDNNKNNNDENNFKTVVEDHENVEPKESRSLIMVDGETEIEMETLFKASAYVLGSSGATIVYKAVLQDGAAFAVRRIGESGVVKVKEFESRVRAIAKMRHRNLVRVRGFYWGDDEKLVICDYISNGSLANFCYRKNSSSPYHLSLETRLKIAKGVARGLTYIHEKKNVHGNIKPSNILLNADMEPVISDLGLHWLTHGKNAHKPDGPARHFGSKRSTSSHDDLHETGSPYTGPAGFVGCTSPYHAPESLNNLKPHPKWDVYSFGILLLELLTGKVFSDRELGQWTASSVAEDPARILRMADVAIRVDVTAREEATLAWFKLGFSCASLVPQKRPCMKDALHVLEKNQCSN